MLGGRGEEGETEYTLRTVVAEQTDRWAKDCGSGEGRRGRTERPPSVGDAGDRQTQPVRALRGKGEIERLADSCP